MDWAIVAMIAAAAGAGGFATGHWQHLLYSDPAHRVRGWGAGHVVRLAGLAVGFAAVAALALRPDHYDAGPAIITALFGMALVVLASTDFERRLLPNRLMYPAILAAAALCWAWPDRSIGEIWIGATVGIGVGAGLFLFGAGFGALRGLRAVPFGMGDAKLILLIGLLAGWPAIGSALLIGVLMGGIPALVMLLAGRSTGVFSYGPYLAAGALAVLLFPSQFV